MQEIMNNACIFLKDYVHECIVCTAYRLQFYAQFP